MENLKEIKETVIKGKVLIAKANGNKYFKRSISNGKWHRIAHQKQEPYNSWYTPKVLTRRPIPEGIRLFDVVLNSTGFHTGKSLKEIKEFQPVY